MLRIVAIVVLACWILLFLFVGESFWERTPHPKSRQSSTTSRLANVPEADTSDTPEIGVMSKQIDGQIETSESSSTSTFIPEPQQASHTKPSHHHVRFSGDAPTDEADSTANAHRSTKDSSNFGEELSSHDASTPRMPSPIHEAPNQTTQTPTNQVLPDAHAQGGSAPFFEDIEKRDSNSLQPDLEVNKTNSTKPTVTFRDLYTTDLKSRPPLTFAQQLKPYNGRLTNDSFFKVMLRPFILFAYPAVLWSSVVYACAVGWLIVLSESVAEIYRKPETYNFSALSTGLIYLSPFIGGILGTAVAGKVSDIIVRFMSKRNGGLYEPEFRLVMAFPVAITTVIGLMGFGWSAENHDSWIIPTVFFGIISFGCSLGSTTAITFCVDSYRQYAGEALVTLNFSKNIFHGLVFSLFVNHWLEHSGSKSVFIWLGVVQLILMVFTIPMYIFGKRARMWTVRMNLMEKF